MSVDTQLARILDWLWGAPHTPEVEAKARLLLLDTIGCALAASTHPQLRQFRKILGDTDGHPVATSAALFAASACWDEACEGLARAHGRPGVAVIAALQALAPGRKATLGEVLAALVAGYEAGARFGEALRIGPGMHVDATWPSLGVAVSVVHLCKGNAEQALAAVRIAGCQVPRSLYLPVKAGAEARNTYLPHAAQLGLLAAQAALAGMTAPEGVLDELGAKPLTAAGEWLILEGYLKPFAAVRHVHYAAAAGLSLHSGLKHVERAKSIALSTYGEAITYCGNRAPRNAIQAQFSLSYGLAHALLFGTLGPDAYAQERIDDSRLREVENKISIEEDGALTEAGKRAARVVVDTEDGKVEAFADRVAGDPALPMTRAEILAKFSRYAGRDGATFLDADAREPFSIPA